MAESNCTSSNFRGSSHEPIVVVGMGMRVPGGIHTADDLWDLVVNKRTTRCKVPSDRFNIDAFHSPSNRAGSIAMTHGHFLVDTDDIRYLDTSFFSMNKREVDSLDPQQRMLLEVVYECMQSSGQANWRGGNIGCYVGVWGEDWLDINAKNTQDKELYSISGGHDFAISNRVSYEYDLKGPSFTIKSGCSSSMIGLHQACRAIQAGDCTSAIVAGTNLILSPTMSIAMSRQGVLSADGSCKSFDVSADGYARGEAINAIYIKRLGDALRNRDPIRAIIRATASNCDGKTLGMFTPSLEAHEAMIRRAYQEAYLDPVETAFIEAHATGTPTGDPLEANAIARVFGSDHGMRYVGSVKPNLGHSEGASGVSSILKTVLALERGFIPPNINFSTLNPKIPFKEANISVPVEAMPWPKDLSERASINSFGIGGANAHVVLDSAASFGLPGTWDRCGGSTNGHGIGDGLNGHASLRPALLVLSTSNSDSLRRSLVKINQYVEKNITKLKDVSYTLCNRREHHSYRAFCVTNGSAALKFSPVTKTKKTSLLTLVFTGQGAQWAGMAKELMEDYPSFRDDINTMSAALARLSQPPSWNIREELLKTDSLSHMSKAEYAQPLTTAVQVAIVNLLQKWDISPAATAVVGHSSGEIAAAYAAQAITKYEAIIIAYYRGQITKPFGGQGGMAAVDLSREQVTKFLTMGVQVAYENSQNSVTLSGDKEALDGVCKRIQADMPDAFVRILKVDVAYYSHHMRKLGEFYEALLQPHLQSKAPTVPFISSVTAKGITGVGQFNAAYWRANLEQPVLFNSAIKLLVGTDPQVQLFLEIGLHAALTGPIRQITKAMGRTNDSYVSALNRGSDCTESILKMVGELHLQNLPVNFANMGPPGVVLTDLPLYQWCHDEVYWSESRASQEWRLRKFPHHEILGSRTAEGNTLQPEWRNVLRLEDVPWLRDHKIIEDVVFPCAGYLCMVGEGIRQITAAEDFTLRNVVIQRGLVLSDTKPVEVMTSFRPVKLTLTLDSVWWEFTIYTFNGSIWTKHCNGQIRPGKEATTAPCIAGVHPRLVPAPYPAFRRIGLNYGPAFQGLEQVSALPKKRTAAAALKLPLVSESSYALHPTTIDHCLQLFMVAACEGTFRQVKKLCVPTGIEHLYVRGGMNSGFLRAEAIAKSGPTGEVSGDAVVVAGGELILSLTGGKFSPLGDDVSDEMTDTIAGARLKWKPDLDLVKIESLIRPRGVPKTEMEAGAKLTILSIIEINHRTVGLSPKKKHLQKFCDWIKIHIERAADNKYDFVTDEKSLLALNSEERASLILNLQNEVAKTGLSVFGELFSRVVDNCQALVQGEVNGIEILLPGDGLTRLYNSTTGFTDCTSFFVAAGHSNPTLRVLEIGAGTGGMSAVALQALTSDAARMYSIYTYTDISAGFFTAAQDRFQDYQGLEYRILDISKDPVDQGFQEGSYDLIVASNVLHATPSLHETLTHVRRLLAPSGRLFLQGVSPTLRIMNLIMGVLPGWWLGEADNRINEPYVTPQRWDMELRRSGFSGIDAAVYDNIQPYQINVNIVSRPAKTAHSTRRVTVLHHPDLSPPYIGAISKAMAEQGIQTDLHTIHDKLPTGQDIISLLEIETPFFDNIAEEDFTYFQEVVKNLGANGLLWVTRSVQMECPDPRFGLCLGLARSLRNELSAAIATLEIDSVDFDSCAVIINVFNKFQERSVEWDARPDFEFVASKGIVNIGRYHPVSVAQELAMAAPEPQAVHLEIKTSGLLQTLKWVPYQEREMRSDEIIVEPRGVGLNFKDVLYSMGIIDMDEPSFGLEGSGVVAAVGAMATNFKVGAHVWYMGQNCMSTRTTIEALRCARMPSTLSWEEAATMPCVYATAIHSLIHLGQLKKGQTVLIHSACGGVGLAAIQVCQNIVGAKVYATVGSEEKAQYLVDAFGISRGCIFNSRDMSFLPAIKAVTGGRGVDLVLNSLSGELLHASWQCVAEHGKMVEIGKRDFIGKAQLNMDRFESNKSFFGVDLARFDGAKCQLLLQEMVEFYEAGLIKPITPMNIFAKANIEDSFRYMQNGSHIGKIVVAIPEAQTDIQSTAKVPNLELEPEACYLLVGGLGGLGKAVATWMKDQAFFRELESQDCSVQVVTGSVATFATVQKVTNIAYKPIRGVLQMSMVLRDREFLNMSLSDWQTAVLPKVQGTWNLHHALPRDLDFFVLASSTSGSFGNLGQANYAAAGTILDAFVEYRHSQNMVASVLDIGPIGDIGYVNQHAEIYESLRASGCYFLHEKDLLDSLHWAIAKSGVQHLGSPTNGSQLAIGIRSQKSYSDPSSRFPWGRDARMDAYRNMKATTYTANPKATDQLQAFMSSIEANPAQLDSPASLQLLATEIGTRFYSFMRLPTEEFDVTQSFAMLGVDSLVMMEVGNWMKRSLGGMYFSTLEIQNAGTIEALAALTIQKLKERFEVGTEEMENTYLLTKAP